MTSKRSILIGGCVLALLLATVTLVTSRGASAARPFGLHSLDGAYHFSVAEVREETEGGVTETVYCNSYGIIVFDGAGGATIAAGDGYDVCSNGDNAVEDGCFTYEVDAFGGVLITELDDENGCIARPAGEQYATHCQLVDKGALLLCDGTAGGPAADRPDDLLLWTATAGKL